MAKSFLVDLNLNQNEIQNGVIQNLASDPAEGVKGQLYFNTAVNKPRVYNGTEWANLEKGTGTVTSVGISNTTDGSLTITGTPVTTSGVINIEHANSIEAQTTSGIYPIKIDKNGHISEYGTALGNVSSSADGLMPANKAANQSSTKVGSSNYVWDATQGKYAQLPATAFSDTTYTDGTAGYTLKAKQDKDGNEFSATYAKLASPALTGTPTATSGTNNTQIATTEFVQSAIGTLAGGMRFKGTVGTGGTAGTTLPTTGVEIGDTYRTSSAGSFGGQSNCRIGDLFIATETTPVWAYIPSGNDEAVTSVTAGAGLTGGTITSTGTIALETTGVTSGSYQGLTIDEYGRVTEAQDMGYTSNTGTVTSVGITNSTDGSLTITSSPVTTSGSINIEHTNSVTPKTTQAVYPIKIDSSGHISAVGSAVTVLKRYSGNITGDASKTSFTVTHNLGTRDIIAQVYDNSTYDEVMVDIIRTNTNTATIAFAKAPANGKVYRVVCIG